MCFFVQHTFEYYVYKNCFKMKYNFPKQEKVVSLKIINALFEKGTHQVFLFPFKISLVIITNQAVSSQVLIIVPKRNFKKAVDRNKIKRQIREIYRLNKEPFLTTLNNLQIQVALSVAFVGKNNLDYTKANSALIKALKMLSEYIEKNNSISIHPAN